MSNDTAGPILIFGGIVILALQARVVARGAFSAGRFSGLSRQSNPLGFWFIAGINVLLGLASLVFGVRNLVGGH